MTCHVETLLYVYQFFYRLLRSHLPLENQEALQGHVPFSQASLRLALQGRFSSHGQLIYARKSESCLGEYSVFVGVKVLLAHVLLFRNRETNWWCLKKSNMRWKPARPA